MMKIRQARKIIAIVGPTASGKSDLAVHIAKWIMRRGKGAEIVSADSRQIYRGMDIGTAKPTKRVQALVPHHLIDIKNPSQHYTLAHYKRDALRAIERILHKKRLPILVGGTGLYLDAVTENLEIPEVKPNKHLRRQLEGRLAREGLETLFQELVRRDHEAEYIVDRKNPRRVIRALEVVLTTQRPFSASRKRGEPLFDVLKIGIAVPPEELQRRINRRVDLMFRRGLVAEVRRLVAWYGPRAAAFDAIGYREIIAHLNGSSTKDEARAAIVRNTRRYAKRQMTWFKRDKAIVWVSNEKKSMILTSAFLTQTS